ncbi:MAG TPA: endonuclease domain-containing protein [Longimicrobium sp.]|nr:endonuclease domain-containing protein [Longimicrobium sp.]
MSTAITCRRWSWKETSARPRRGPPPPAPPPRFAGGGGNYEVRTPERGDHMKRRSRWRSVSPEIRDAARAMRKSMTPAEAVLWKEFRDGRFDGVPIRRQHTVGRFILDFYAPAHHLAIEIDGDIHDAQQERDAARTEALAERGIRVIRFRNDEVLGNLNAVLERLRRELHFQLHGEPEV